MYNDIVYVVLVHEEDPRVYSSIERRRAIYDAVSLAANIDRNKEFNPINHTEGDLAVMRAQLDNRLASYTSGDHRQNYINVSGTVTIYIVNFS